MEKISANSRKNVNNKKIAKTLRSQFSKKKRLLLMNKSLKIILIILTLNTLKIPT
jgi:hypothetical protein